MSAASAFIAWTFGQPRNTPSELILMGLFFGFIGDAALLSQKEEAVPLWASAHSWSAMRSMLPLGFPMRP